MTLTKFELHAPEGIEATTWAPGGEGLLRLWIKNEGEALTDYPSVVVEPIGEGWVVDEGEVVLYGLGSSIQLKWTVRAGADQKTGAKLRARVRVFAYNADFRQGKDPVGQAELTLEVGQAFAK